MNRPSTWPASQLIQYLADPDMSPEETIRQADARPAPIGAPGLGFEF